MVIRIKSPENRLGRTTAHYSPGKLLRCGKIVLQRALHDGPLRRLRLIFTAELTRYGSAILVELHLRVPLKRVVLSLALHRHFRAVLGLVLALSAFWDRALLKPLSLVGFQCSALLKPLGQALVSWYTYRCCLAWVGCLHASPYQVGQLGKLRREFSHNITVLSDECSYCKRQANGVSFFFLFKKLGLLLKKKTSSLLAVKNLSRTAATLLWNEICLLDY